MNLDEGREIVFVISSLSPGGAEKVISELANEAVKSMSKVYLILLTKQEKFYEISKGVELIEPDFTMDKMSRLQFQMKNFMWLRSVLKKISAPRVLSFSGKYNSFVLLASLFLRKRVFISDRSRPGISYGRFLDTINPIVYRTSAGIIAQTSQAQIFAKVKTKHENIGVIPNPVNVPIELPESEREKIIINVGRFIQSKHQGLMLEFFNDVHRGGWNLSFLGDGDLLPEVKAKAKALQNYSCINFLGNVKNMEDYYRSASVFAFTSSSEGFPNSLAEAMAHGCACIAFDCTAGPSDIITNGVDGFLIPEGDYTGYKEKLDLLMTDEALTKRFSKAAKQKMQRFEKSVISERYFSFVLGTSV
jgi:GalNAc-alpha-(1->4)-GalNAc-alpha-(1->3)-diNAcBac-PP-undecaprenol alpha-1,4-N-acetyl-D-galactosaminyltransferase